MMLFTSSRIRASLVALLLALTTPAGAQLIVLDPGHGGSDPGAVGCSLQEKMINLDVSSRTRVLLEGAGLRVEMTRTADAAVSLGARSSFANSRSADRFVSFHANSNAGTPATGTETFAYTSASAASINLRDHIQREMVATWGLRDRGGKVANFSVLRNTTMPAALSEMAFVNNCGIDAVLLGDPAERQRMAEAHYRAILAHLGITEPPMGEATIVGVAYEDVGVGLEDTTRRIVGAQVMVDGGAPVTTDRVGAFSLRVPPGEHTVRVSHPDFLEGSRTCTIAGTGETWCSVGAMRRSTVDAGVPDASADASVPDASPDLGEPDATPEIDAEPTPDGSVDRPPSTGCGRCSTGSGSSRGGLVLSVLVLLMFWRRRLHMAAVAALVLLIGCAQPSASDGARSALGPGGSSYASVDGTVDCSVIEVAAALDARPPVEARELASGAFDEAEGSPTGSHIALASEGRALLELLEIETGDRVELARGRRAGFAPVWSHDGDRIGFRSPDQTETAVPTHWRTVAGDPAQPQTPERHAFADGEGTVIVVEGARRTRIAPPGDRYFAPRLSPDGSVLVFRGLSTGLYVYLRTNGRIVSLGEGGRARFSPDSRLLVFERIEDDGHAFTRSTVRVTDLRSPTLDTYALASDATFAGSPSVDRDGRVYYLTGAPGSVDRAVVLARLP